MTPLDGTTQIRPAFARDMPGLEAWQNHDPVAWVDGSRLREGAATREYRPEWSWVAERSGRVVARALWWGMPAADRPTTLDCLQVTGVVDRPEDIGAALIRAALAAFGTTPALEFNVDVSPEWRNQPGAVEAVRWRQDAARAGGFDRTTERVSYARADTDPLPDRSTRVRFVAGADEEFRDLFARVAPGSLDSHTVDMVTRAGVAALADDDLAFYLSLPGNRGAWKVAQLSTDERIGFIIPTRTRYDASISYLGVLPEYRGHGYVHDLLSEMVHVHHGSAQDRVVGTTDAVNTPMRKAFERAGFAVTRVRIVHTTSHPSAG